MPPLRVTTGLGVYLSLLQTGSDSKRKKTPPIHPDQIRSRSHFHNTNTTQYNSTVQPFERNVQYRCCNGGLPRSRHLRSFPPCEIGKGKGKGKGKDEESLPRRWIRCLYIYLLYEIFGERERKSKACPRSHVNRGCFYHYAFCLYIARALLSSHLNISELRHGTTVEP